MMQLNSNQYTQVLNLSLAQMAAESYLDRLPGLDLRTILNFGNNNPAAEFKLDANNPRLPGATRMTDSLFDRFSQVYDIRATSIYHQPNDSSGFSAVLLHEKNNPNNYVLSFRSTEYRDRDQGGDFEHDALVADNEIATYGFAFGQLLRAEDFYNSIKDSIPAGANLYVTGYSLGGHLATVFTEMHPEVTAAYTFNGPGRGYLNGIGDGARIKTMLDYFRDVLMHPDLEQYKPDENIDSERLATAIYSSAVSKAQNGDAFSLSPADKLNDDSRYQWALIKTSNHFNTFSPWANEATSLAGGRITQVYGHAPMDDTEIVANSGVHSNIKVPVFIEDQPDIEGYVGKLPILTDLTRKLAGDFGNTHALVLIVDSLALAELFMKADASLTQEKVESIFKVASNERAPFHAAQTDTKGSESNSLEQALFLLEKALGLKDTALSADRTPGGFGNYDFRQQFYQRIDKVAAKASNLQIKLIGADVDVLALAKQDNNDGLAARFALFNLSPVVILGVDYSAQKDKLALFDEKTGVGLTSQYLEDRAEFLQRKSYLGEQNLNNDYTDAVNNNGDSSPTSKADNKYYGDGKYFEDIESKYIVHQSTVATDSLSQHKFGNAENNNILGGNKDDHLYGMDGQDTLNGGKGDDYIEGGQGNDELVGDTGHNWLDGGVGHDKYVISSGSDVVVDADGDGEIVFDGRKLTGGTSVVDGAIYRDEQNVQYLFEEQGDGKGKLTIRSDKSECVIQDFHSGMFDIVLSYGQLTPPSTKWAVSDLVTWSWYVAPFQTEGGWSGDMNFDYYGVLLADTMPGTGGMYLDTPRAGIAESDEYFVALDNTPAFPSDEFIVTSDGISPPMPNDVNNFYGRGGDDLIDGSRVSRSLFSGGSGSDTLIGSQYSSGLLGGGGDDLIVGGNGDDYIQGDPEIIQGATLDINYVLFSYTSAFNNWSTNFSDVYGDYALPEFSVGYVNEYDTKGNNIYSGLSEVDMVGANNSGDGAYVRNKNYFTNRLNYPHYSSHKEAMDILIGSDFDKGGNYNDTLFGGDGNDGIEGGAGADFVVGGNGNDTLLGSWADDENNNVSYLYNLGFWYGKLAILDSAGGVISHISEIDKMPLWNTNPLPFDVGGKYGLDGNDVLLGLDGNDAIADGWGSDILDGGNGDDQLINFDFRGDGQAQFNQLLGGSGQDWIASANYSTSGIDYFDGGDGNDCLVALHGNAVMYGGNGNDIYVIKADLHGLAQISDSAGNESVLITSKPGAHLQLEDLQLSRSDGLVNIRSQAGGLNLNIYGDQATLGRYSVKLVDVDSDNKLLIDQAVTVNITDLVVDNGVADEGQDVLQAKKWLDAVSKTGFSANVDDLAKRFSDLAVNATATEGDDILFAGSSADALNGVGGNDQLIGLGGNDTLNGGVGNDTLDGGDGDDIYVFDLNSGVDVIRSSGASLQEQDLVRFSAGVLPADVNVRRTGFDLFLQSAAKNISIKLENWFSSAGHRVAAVEFADGVRWDEASLATAAIAGTDGDDVLDGDIAANQILGLAGNDTLLGLGGNDSLDGGAGNDELDGGDGDDIYVFGPGFGQDVIRDASGIDQIQMAQGISPADISLWRDAYALHVILGQGADRLSIEGFGFGTSPIESIKFADGTVWDTSILLAAAYVGTADDDSLMSGSDNDLLKGLAGNDYLVAGDGNDTLDGGTGNDTLSGDAGNDMYLFGPGSGQDTVTDSAGSDVVQIASGVKPSDVSIWRDASSLYVGVNGSGDLLTVSGWFDATTNRVESVKFEDGTVWDSTVLQSAAFGGTDGDDYLNGSTGNDRLFGRGGNDYLVGDIGNDTLDGGTGNDTLSGDAGNDTYVFGLGAGQDSITDTAGTDVVLLNAGISASDVTIWRDTSNLYVGINNTSDVLTISGWYDASTNRVESIKFADGMIWATSVLQAAAFGGTEGDDYLSGTTGSDRLLGFAGNDNLFGDTGNDTLDGGKGNDTLSGDAGNDVYLFGNGDGQDVITDSAGTADIVRFKSGVIASDVLVSRDGNNLYFTLISTGDKVTVQNHYIDTAARIEKVEFADGSSWDLAAINAKMSTASNGADFLWGSTANDTLNGLDGNDQLAGNDGNDSLLGGAGNDTLDGGIGNDSLVGGAGDDTYIVDATTDVITENLDEGTDTVNSAVTFTLGANLENLTLIGSAAINGTGNTLSNVLIGNDQANQLLGDVGDDTLIGGAGNDSLNGGAGSDRLVGGSGNDTYVLDVATDTVEELAAEGTDTIQAGFTYTLGDNFENLTLTGSAAVNGTGNSANNTITGNSGANLLTGLAGNDVLNGGAGVDTMIGGIGNDTYTVDNVGDVVTENLNEGTDKVNSSITYTLGSNLENLTLTGSGTLNGTGNELANALTGNTGNNVLTGLVGNDTLDGGTGTDTLVGGVGDDIYIVDNTADVVTENLNEGSDTVKASATFTLSGNIETLILTGTAAMDGTGNSLNNSLTGNDYNNILNGGAGADTMTGAFGDDTYVVDDAGDTIVEIASGGTDTVQSGINYTLGNELENLTLTGSIATTATGNGLNNTIIGNTLANVMLGGAGNDTLKGGAGNDALQGEAGADNLQGEAGNDTLDGGAGNDVLTGGAGNDTYVLGRGYGAETVTDNDTTAANTDVASFMSGIATDQIWFRKVNTNDLEVSVIGTSDKLTLKSWYLGNQYHLEQFKTADGKLLVDTDVQKLVDAMAAFAPPAAGQTTLPSNYQTSLSPILAANWH